MRIEPHTNTEAEKIDYYTIIFECSAKKIILTPDEYKEFQKTIEDELL